MELDGVQLTVNDVLLFTCTELIDGMMLGGPAKSNQITKI